MPDRVAMLRIDGNQIVATTADGSATTLDAAGKVVARQVPVKCPMKRLRLKLAAEFEKQVMPGRIVKLHRRRERG